MKLKVSTLFLAAALTLVVAAGMVQATTVTIYSENFESANVGDGLAANLGWTLYDWSGLHDIYVGQDLHPGPGEPAGNKAADGSTVGGYYGSVVRPISIPQSAISVKLTYSYYGVVGAGTWGSSMGFWSGVDGEWNEARWAEAYWDAEGWTLNTYRTYAITYVMDEWVTGTIDINLVNMTVQGSLVGSVIGGAQYTPVMPISHRPTYLWYMSRDAEGNCGMDVDNIVVTAEVPASHMSGTITLQGWTSPTGDNKLTPVRLELLNSSTGDTVFDQLVNLDVNGHYDVDLYGVPSGTYNVYFTAAKWLRKLAAANREILDGDQEQVSAELINGDTDGDNAVTSIDLGVVVPKLDVTGD